MQKSDNSLEQKVFRGMFLLTFTTLESLAQTKEARLKINHNVKSIASALYPIC